MRRRLSIALIGSGLLIGAPIAFTAPADACSRVFSNDNGVAMVVGRTMDLYMDDHAALELRPRALKHGGFLGIEDPNPLSWTSKYGSVGINSLSQGISDGVNEKGLDANLLYLSDTSHELRDPRREAVQAQTRHE
jgi:penicillin V acylase-like amidase (Ntn superfamily)